MEFENASPALFLALHVYDPSMRFDVVDNRRMDWPREFLIVARGGGGSSPLSNVHDIAGLGTPLALQFMKANVPSRTVWFLGSISTTGKTNLRIKEVLTIKNKTLT